MVILSSRCIRKIWLTGIIAAAAASPSLVRASDAELIDVAARIDYGYYAGDARVVAGARADLERLRPASGARDYYLGYAAYRLSQLEHVDDHHARRQQLGDCIDAARAALDDPAWVVEAWVLIAACSLEGRAETVRALGHELRLSEALEAARALDADHPRVLLLEGLALAAGDGRVEQIRMKLVAARERFDAWPSKGVQPTWGRAETFAHLAALSLDAGDRREARDLIEQSLLEAPGYRFALELQNRLSLPHR